ncbi:MAG: Exodeoxyribonuclease III, partial [uncultured Solirubrobacteraceae bacterium]
CGSRRGTSTRPSSACPGCWRGSTSGGRTWCACRRRSSPTRRSPPCSATSWPRAATRWPRTA